jgi:hypothetical protein
MLLGSGVATTDTLTFERLAEIPVDQMRPEQIIISPAVGGRDYSRRLLYRA